MFLRKLLLFSSPSFQKYHTLQTSSSLSDVEFLPRHSISPEKEPPAQQDQRISSPFGYSLLWALSTLFFASLSLVLWLRLPSTSETGSFEKGFATELGNMMVFILG